MRVFGNDPVFISPDQPSKVKMSEMSVSLGAVLLTLDSEERKIPPLVLISAVLYQLSRNRQ